MEINATNLTTLILDTIDELKRLQGIWKEEFRDVPPVLWFGNLNEKQTPLKGRVLVISANPSRPEQPKNNPRIPYSEKWNTELVKVEELMKDYNNYFVNNPYKQWFGGNPSNPKGRIEDFLNGLGASFYQSIYK